MEAFEQTWPTTSRTFERMKWLATAVAEFESQTSSCTSSTLRPSHVLVAMGVLTHGNVRVSLHRDSTEDEVRGFLDVLPGIVAGLRARAGVVGL